MKSWIEISEARLTHNYTTLTSACGDRVAVLAVIKADAYGHGAIQCAPVLARAGAPWLGVTNVKQGVEVRQALADFAQQPRLLVMSGSLPEESRMIALHGLTPVVWTIAQLEALSAAARELGVTLPVHLEIDTGMSRQGCAVGEELDAVLAWLVQHPEIALDGVMTHFASSEIAGSTQTAAQQRVFAQAVRKIAATTLRPAWLHAGASSAIDNLHGANLHGAGEGVTTLQWLAGLAARLNAQAMVRAGIAVYGYCLPVEREAGYTGPAESSVRAQLEPVLTWKARVIGVHEFPAGARVGYGGTFTAQRSMRLALLPVGYADGLRRELSSSSTGAGWVMLHEQRAPIVGRISMNLTAVDVTTIAGVAVGDEAIVLGAGVTAEDHAAIAGTIPYEILCGMRDHQLLTP